jgi:hypothetical protein
MTTRLAVGLAAVVATVAIPTSATAQPPNASPIDITNVELVGSPAGSAINVFGTVRCQSAGPLLLDVTVEQNAPVGLAAGSNNNIACAAAGDTVQWVVTATPGGVFVVNEMVHVTACVFVAADGTDEEDHLLRRAT